MLHDFLSGEAAAGRFARSDADGLFRRAMRELDVGYVRRRLMWVGVRWGGRLKGGTVGEKAIVIGISIVAGPLAGTAAQLLVWLYQAVEWSAYAARWITRWLLGKDPPKDRPRRPTVYYRSG